MKAGKKPEEKEARKLTNEAYYAEPVERVWKALTDPKELAKWFLPAEPESGGFKAVPGHRFRWTTKNPFGPGHCEVEEVRENERMSFKITHEPGMLVSFVTWSVRPEGEGTRFTVEHEFVTESELKPHPAVVSMALHRHEKAFIRSRAAWTMLLELLADQLQNSCRTATWRKVA